jgi:hypothetical protein
VAAAGEQAERDGAVDDVLQTNHSDSPSISLFT